MVWYEKCTLRKHGWQQNPKHGGGHAVGAAAMTSHLAAFGHFGSRDDGTPDPASRATAGVLHSHVTS